MRHPALLLTTFALACDLGQPSAPQNEAVSSDAAQSTPSEGFAVGGSVRFTGQGPLRMFIADEKTFETPMAGVQGQVLRPSASQLERGSIRYRFDDLPAGTYAIRCFQDENDNGKLDRGLTGPKEPWGMSFRPGKGKRMRPPKFEEVSFDVDADISGLDIIVD